MFAKFCRFLQDIIADACRIGSRYSVEINGNINKLQPRLSQLLEKLESLSTRQDTRPIPVADGWGGAEMRDFTLVDSRSRTNGPTVREYEIQEKITFFKISPLLPDKHVSRA